MKKIFLISLVFLQSSILFSQVGIGTTIPRATLEISNSDNGGLLIPQYALTGSNDATTVVNLQGGALVDGTLVYNTTAITGGNALVKGFVYWDAITSSWNEVGGGSTTESWELTGNNVASTNFLGTTNTQPIYFRVNNTQIGRLDPQGGISFGFGTNISSQRSIGIGSSAIASNTDGIAIGTEANSGSQYTIAIGEKSAATNTNAIAIGREANSSAQFTVAIGQNSDAINTDAIAIGREANSSAQFTIAIGQNSDAINTDAIAIGRDARASGQNSIAIGTNTSASSNEVSIGNTSINAIRGQVPFTTYSDKRFKYDVKENVPGLEFIEKLTPVTYAFDRSKLSLFKKETKTAKNTEKRETGFLAQDVLKIAQSLGYDFNGVYSPKDLSNDAYGISYSSFVVPLVKAVQEQQDQITSLKKEVEELQMLKQELLELKALFTKE